MDEQTGENMKTKLSYACIDVRPRAFDFSKGFAETWNIPLNLTEQEISDGEYMPMMNFIYSLGGVASVPTDFREKLVNTTIVEIDGEYYLALTGGGMDMSWEICESYINLGFYPPTYFTLPHMSGRGTSKHDKHIMGCCEESLRVEIMHCQDRLSSLVRW